MVSNVSFRVIIPACYDSFNLSGKPLLDICGKPMIQYVYELALESGAESVVIATDDPRIEKAAKDFDAKVCMTSSDHRSGTERLAEALVTLSYDPHDIIVNLSCDNPLVPPDVVHQIAVGLTEHDTVKVATACEPIKNPKALFSPDVVKVVMNKRGYALYFSRAPIAWERDSSKKGVMKGPHYRHLGIYAYRCSFLEEYMCWEHCELEKMERLEQLRVLWNAGRIYTVVGKKSVPVGVKTTEDLERVRKIISAKVATVNKG